MKLPSFIKLPRHKKFAYRPRYYDEAKEEMKDRVERIKQEIEREEGKDTVSAGGESMRRSIKSRWRKDSYGKTVKNSNYRVMIILFIILLILWYVFK
jgi:t-SNARE complex subunit (syntaxin)